MTNLADLQLAQWRKRAVFHPPIEVGGLGRSGAHFFYLTPSGRLCALTRLGHTRLAIIDLFVGARRWPSSLWPTKRSTFCLRHARAALMALCERAGEIDPSSFGFRKQPSGRLVRPVVPDWLWETRFKQSRRLP